MVLPIGIQNRVRSKRGTSLFVTHSITTFHLQHQVRLKNTNHYVKPNSFQVNFLEWSPQTTVELHVHIIHN